MQGMYSRRILVGCLRARSCGAKVWMLSGLERSIEVFPKLVASRKLSTENRAEKDASSAHTNQSSADELKLDDGDDSFGDGEVLLYRESQRTQIMLMLGVSGVNLLYWGSQLAHYVMYKDVVVEGIELTGDPFWGTFGSIATGFFLYFTKTYANHTVFQSYETADGKRIGFQTHTILGKPGRKFEVSIGNARFNNPVNLITAPESAFNTQKGGFFSWASRTSFVPLTVQGFKGNVLFDSEGKFFNKERLVELLTSTAQAQQAESKEARAEWKRQSFKNQRKKKN